MLGDEDGVASHGRLLAVVGRLGWSQPLPQELVRVLGDGLQPLLLQVLRFFRSQTKPAAEL
jgi:hypothetical protein